MQLSILAAAVTTVLLVPSAQAADDLTIAPETPSVGNCWPFGQGSPIGEFWTPYFAFFYKNIPPFVLRPGDRLAFDLGAPNVESPSADIEVDIAMAPMTTNGGSDEAQPFKRVVTNKQTPTNPHGDDVVGNFELGYKARSKFKFPGEGLAIRFSNPSAAFLADDTCDQVLVGTDSFDPSGFFLARAGEDEDGVAPWDLDDSNVGGFRILHAPKTKIAKGPKGETDESDAKFKLKSSDPGSKFKCKLDGKRYKRCGKSKRFDNIEPGKHVFKAKAKDPDGLVDPTPAKRKWEITP